MFCLLILCLSTLQTSVESASRHTTGLEAVTEEAMLPEELKPVGRGQGDQSQWLILVVTPRNIETSNDQDLSEI